MRASRLVSKDRVQDAIEAALDELEATPPTGLDDQEEVLRTITDSVWAAITEMDDQDDLGMLAEEDAE